MPLVEVRSFDECRATLADMAGGLLLLEATSANWAAAFELLDWCDAELPTVPVVVATDRRLSRLAPVARELGVVQVVTSPRGLAPQVEVAARHLASLPKPELTAEQSIRDRLPWKPVASA